MDLAAVFFTGLLTGGLTCLAVQGGLLATLIGRTATPVIFFLAAKLAAYTVLGFLLGSLGAVFQLSLTMKIGLQLAVVIFMLGHALNLLNVHPVFRYFVLTPPRFLTRLVKDQSKSKDFFTPVLLGAFTIFIPCGTTQAMMALALGAGNPWLGAAVMFAFVLGTTPLFFILGYVATRLGELARNNFARLSAALIIILAIFNLDGTLALADSRLTFSGAARGVYCLVSFCGEVRAAAAAALTTASINFSDSGYDPQIIPIKAGEKISLNLINREGRGCIQSFTIPALGIQKIVRTGTKETINFLAPSRPGELAFMCGMGMYRGKFLVQ